jgi:hypothetical protein
MGHKLYRVTAFENVGKYTLRIQFDDGAEQVIDFEPVLYGPVFEPLRNLELFNQVKLVEEVGCLEWPTGADFDPETLRNWPDYKDEIIAERRRQYAVVS